MRFRMKSAIVAAVALAPLGTALAQTPAAGNPTRGATLYTQRCAICHTVDPNTVNRLGPNLKAIVGRKAADVPGFNYSPAMKASDITWSRTTLDPYLASPARVVPRGFMVLATPNPTDRADIIAYLETLK